MHGISFPATVPLAFKLAAAGPLVLFDRVLVDMGFTNPITICRNSGISWSFFCRDNPDASLDQGLKTANSEVLDSNLPCILVQPMWVKCYTQSTGTLPGVSWCPHYRVCAWGTTHSVVWTPSDEIQCHVADVTSCAMEYVESCPGLIGVVLIFCMHGQARFWKRISSVWESPSVLLHILTWYGCLTPSLNMFESEHSWTREAVDMVS